MKNTNQFQDKEIWKEIAGFEDRYAVSNRGRVMNLKTGRVLKHGIDGHRYVFVALCNGNGKPKQIRIHRLVAQAFIPNPLNLPQVDHVDENKGNNDVSNLRWVTASENRVHSNHQHSCKINQLSLDGVFIRLWESSHEINRDLGFHQGNIIQCCKGERKTAYDYRWEYADPSQQRKFNRPVAVLTKDGEFVAKYKSAAEASRCLNICVQSIHYCLKGTCKSTNGLKFIYI